MSNSAAQPTHRAGEAPRLDFEDFYAASVNRLVAAVYAVTGDVAEAEDAVQEAYARAWLRWDRLTAEGDPTPWIRTVALRLAVSSWRRTRNRVRAHFRHGPPADVPGLTPDHVALVAALRRLKPEQRRAVVLHHLLDLPVEEVARQTRSTRTAVRSRLMRARRILGAHLSETGGPANPGPDVPAGPTGYDPSRVRHGRPKEVPTHD